MPKARDWRHYRKLLAALVGLGFMLAYRTAGLPLLGLEGFVVDAVMSAATAVAVWWFPNEPPPDTGA